MDPDLESAASQPLSESAGSSSGGSDSAQTIKQLADEGKLLLNDNDYDAAQEAFSRTLELAVAQYGELGPECAELYYNYGCALLAGARQENVAFLSRKLQQKIREKETGIQDDADEEEEEDIGDEEALALAWEILETARIIYEKMETKPLELANVKLRLGEAAEENDDIENALKEYDEALQIHKAVAEHQDDPSIRDIISKKAYIYSILKQKADAIDMYTQLYELTQQRIQRLEEAKQSEEEAKELRASLEDLKERIDGLKQWDSDEAPVPQSKAAQLQKMEEILSIDASGPSSSSAAASTASTSNGPAAEASSSSSSNGPVVHNLGVFGRSKRRVAPETTTPPAAAPASAQSPMDTVAEDKGKESAGGTKRKREADEPRQDDDDAQREQEGQAAVSTEGDAQPAGPAAAKRIRAGSDE